MNLILSRPIVFFDTETTGLNIGKDKIIELALLKVNPDGSEETRVWRFNPEIPISKEAEMVHGISNADLKNEPVFAEIADEILSFLENCDLAGYNSNKFDLPLLVEEFLRIDKDFDLRDKKCIDVQNIFHKMEPRNLSAAYRFYCQKELTDAHQALADTRATFEVLKGQLDKYSGKTHEDSKTGKITTLNNCVNLLSDFSRDHRTVDFAGHIVFNENDEEVFNFGKYKGTPVSKVFKIEPPYYDWMMKADFPLYTKKIITKIYKDLKIK
jgi:DNA polymerase-3 subunit epsilon